VIERLSDWAGGGKSLHLLVLDRSFSMRHAERWQQAKEKARDYLQALPAADSVLLLTADENLTLIGEETADPGAVADSLDALSPGYGTLRYQTMMAQLQGLIDEAVLPVRLVLLTDAQANASATRIQDLLPSGISELQILTVGNESDKNAFIREVSSDNRQATTTITALLGGLEEAAAASAGVSLTDAQGQEYQQPVKKNQVGEFVVTFPDLPLDDGINRFTLSLDSEDALPDDNRRYHAIDNGRRYPVYLVGAAENSAASLFLRTALLADERFDVKSLPSDAPRIPDDALMLCVVDASALTDAEQNRVERFLQDGGKVLTVTGETPSTPGQDDFSGQRSSVESIGFVDATHPLISDAAAWRTLRIFQRNRVNTLPDDRVLVSLNDGSTFILERSVGQGRMLLVASVLDSLGDDLPLSPVFAPFVLQAARVYAGLDNASGSLSAGSSLLVRAGAQLFTPAGEAIRELAAIGEENRIHLTEPGIYELRDGGQVRSLTVNIDPAESSMQGLDEDFLGRWQSLAGQVTDGQRQDNPQSSSGPEKQQLWHWFLPLLLVVVILEALYSNILLHVRRGGAA
ncbi:MAG: VWA domain-containing protein, partial [Gammaproteobacteria bacterium]|nr:VWA domain-containing protein [Gammaproteobacteria bacterium]